MWWGTGYGIVLGLAAFQTIYFVCSIQWMRWTQKTRKKNATHDRSRNVKWRKLANYVYLFTVNEEWTCIVRFGVCVPKELSTKFPGQLRFVLCCKRNNILSRSVHHLMILTIHQWKSSTWTQLLNCSTARTEWLMNEFRSAISIGECANVSGNEINSVGTHDSVFIKWKYWCHQITVISRRIIVCFLQFAMSSHSEFHKRNARRFYSSLILHRVEPWRNKKNKYFPQQVYGGRRFIASTRVVCKWLMNPFFDQSNQARFRFARAFAPKWNIFARHFQFLIFEITLRWHRRYRCGYYTLQMVEHQIDVSWTGRPYHATSSICPKNG